MARKYEASDLHGGIKLRNLGKTLLGFIYVYFWTKRANFRHFAEKFALGFLLISLFLLALEVTLEIGGIHVGKIESAAIQAMFFLVVAGVLYTKLREWSDRRKQFYFIQAAKKAAEVLSFSLEEGAIEELLPVFTETFERQRTVCTIAILGSDGTLRVKYTYPPGRTYSHPLALEEGGAGYSCAQGCIVYIPRKKLGHAIVQTIEDRDPYKLVPGLYVPAPFEPYEAILSVPLMSLGKCYGTLNLDSPKPNAFRRLDFEQAVFFGSVVAQILQIRSTAGVEPLRGLDLQSTHG